MRTWIRVLLLIVCYPSAVSAEIYQWRDAQGRLHYGDKPARDTTAEPVRLERLNTMTPVDVPENLFDDTAQPAHSKQSRSLPRLARGSVVMYTTPTCTYCGMAKDYMKRRGIPYRDKDISVSNSARREFLAYGGRGVPLIFIGTSRGTQRLHGFSEARFADVYQRR